MGERFITKGAKGLFQGSRLIIDTETGVQYLLAHWTNVGGLTPLIDESGKPILDPEYAKNK